MVKLTSLIWYNLNSQFQKSWKNGNYDNTLHAHTKFNFYSRLSLEVWNDTYRA